MISLFLNIYYLIFSSLFVAAAVILVKAGFDYLTSAGDSGKASEARKKIFAVISGLLILVSSYIILRTINPNLVDISGIFVPNIKQNTDKAQPQQNILAPIDALGRIKLMLNNLQKAISDDILNSAQTIADSTDKCSCENLKAVCQCQDKGNGPECKEQKCYVGPDSYPCQKTKEDIKKSQEKIMAAADALLYYKNRALEEKKDLEQSIALDIDKKAEWYDQTIKITEENIKKNPQEAKLWQDARKRLIIEKEDLIKGKETKINIAKDLEVLSRATPFFSEPAVSISKLPDQCLSNIDKKCESTCKQGQGYGCSDSIFGCQPDKCIAKDEEDKNPCPIEDIKTDLKQAQKTGGNLNSIISKILKEIDSIKK